MMIWDQKNYELSAPMECNNILNRNRDWLSIFYLATYYWSRKASFKNYHLYICIRLLDVLCSRLLATKATYVSLLLQRLLTSARKGCLLQRFVATAVVASFCCFLGLTLFLSLRMAIIAYQFLEVKVAEIFALYC